MSLEYKGKISILVFIFFLASIIPFCMIHSYRESIVKNRVHELSIAHQEKELGIDKLFDRSYHPQISLNKGEQRE